jgi:hypothetical protein
MSINLAAPATIQCDGDGRWPCREFFQESGVYSTRETRQVARQQGWKVNIKQRYRRTRLDLCPRHVHTAP